MCFHTSSRRRNMGGLKSQPARYRENPLAARFWQKVQDLADQGGVSIEPHCQDVLESFIENGISTMAAEGVDSDEQRIQEAEDNLTKFIQRMNSEAKRKGVAELHE